MTKITLYNTAKRAKEPFAPIDDQNVRMYVCGPTVYDRAHIGNARPVIVFDTLFRLLRHVYGAEHVTYVRNFTDVDDKINATALARREAGAEGTLETLIAERTEETIDWYHSDMDAVGALRPTHEPRATKYISEMQDMIEQLIQDEFAYKVAATVGHNSRAQYVFLDSTRVPTHAFLSVDAFANTDIGYDYGSLSGRSTEDMIAGSRGEVGEGKRNPMDSVLWKPSTIEQPGWESPWGFGRPGWHIECSAMARKLLGPKFDIHGGGLDLLFPHHENELAQCKACDGEDASARFWMHNEMLQVEGKKMSKSLGNFFTVRDLLDQGVPGEVIRFVFLSTHYRKPMDWTAEKAKEAERELRSWGKILEKHHELVDSNGPRKDEPIGPSNGILVALGQDLNTPLALSVLRQHAKRAKHDPWLYGGNLLHDALLLGLDPLSMRWSEDLDFSANDQILILLRKREEAKESKNYAVADEIRNQLTHAGVVVKDGLNGATWERGADFDPSKLEALK